jgi:hypothetical protein
MVEIALCLAIVGFALVAIIGVLPAGLNVQKENREETILNQDSTVWLDAIRAGGRRDQFGVSDELTNYVDRIVVSNWLYTINPAGPATIAIGRTIVGERTQGPNTTTLLTNGAHVVGLLSTPRIAYINPNQFVSNYVIAYCRAISGTAAEKPMQNNADVRDLGFTYRMVVDITPAGSIDPEGILTNTVDRILRDNLADVRLLFRWPLKETFRPGLVLDRPAAGNSKMVFRTQVGGTFTPYPGYQFDLPAKTSFYFLQSRQYQ